MASESGNTDYSLANPDTLTKYKTAGEISARVLAAVKALCVAGARILDVCVAGDRLLEEEAGRVYKREKITKGVGFPTCISPNQVACHLSPIEGAAGLPTHLADGDVVKISLGAQIDGFAANLADTILVGGSTIQGRVADVLMAGWMASEAAIRMIRPGAKNMDVTEAVGKIASAYGCKPVEGMLSYQLERNVLDGKKQIILNPAESHRRDFSVATFEEGEVYNVDILVSTGEGKVRRKEARTTVYRKMDKIYSLKLKASRTLFSEIQKKCGSFPFSIRALEDEKRARMGLVECVQHDLLTPYEVLFEMDGEVIVEFCTTIALGKNGTIRLSGPTELDVARIATEKKLEDEGLLAVIRSPLRKPKKKNKVTAAAAAAAVEPLAA